MKFTHPLPAHQDHGQELYLTDQLLPNLICPQIQQTSVHLILHNELRTRGFVQEYGPQTSNTIFPGPIREDENCPSIDGYRNGSGLDASE